MPEYLSPGVYVEEEDAGSKSLEGVSTSTAGFLGETERGPEELRLITSFGQFKKLYGKSPRRSHLAAAVDGFFRNGGSRCYVGRITAEDDTADAELTDGAGDPVMNVEANGPGEWGESVSITIEDSAMGGDEQFDATVRYWSESRDQINEAGSDDPDPSPDAEENYAELTTDSLSSQFYEKRLSTSSLIDVEMLGEGRPENGTTFLSIGSDSGAETEAAEAETEAAEAGGDSEADADDDTPEIPSDDELDELKYNELRSVAEPFDIDRTQTKEEIKEDLREIRDKQLRTDGGVVQQQQQQQQSAESPPSVSLSDYEGRDVKGDRTGLSAMKEQRDISIVCVPDENQIRGLTEAVVAHCENMGERMAILQAPEQSGRVSKMETPVDSQYAAYYYPWIEIRHPITDREELVPPGGHIAGIYARNDQEEGVWGAPANMVVRGALDLQFDVTKGEQDVLNPKGINCIRSFRGRGIRLWGARTCSSDPNWKYVNVRRLFLYIEQTIEEGTQWAVFETNDQETWSQVESTVESFLGTLWREGGLMGSDEDEAYYVQCGEETMTQDDIDNGRMIVEVGVAPVKPAEFVIFRVSQWKEGNDM